jgi:hypothetical protein
LISFVEIVAGGLSPSISLNRTKPYKKTLTGS